MFNSEILNYSETLQLCEEIQHNDSDFIKSNRKRPKPGVDDTSKVKANFIRYL